MTIKSVKGGLKDPTGQLYFIIKSRNPVCEHEAVLFYSVPYNLIDGLYNFRNS
jgi:hypothetical protein